MKYTNLRDISTQAKNGTLLWLHGLGFIGNTYELAQCYEHGLGVEEDADKATYYYQFAAKCGHIHAQTCLEMMSRCHFTAEEAAQAEQIARKGDAETSYQLYKYYHPSNPAKAIRFLKKAAQATHEHSMIRLALHYKLGKSVRKDISQYAYWLQKAASRGSAFALYELTQGYYMQNESEESCKLHIDLLAKAANNGDCVAQHDMARGHDFAFNWFGYDYFGDCKYRDYEECLLVSAQNGYLPAMCELGEFYRDENNSDTAPKVATFWIKKAAMLGYSKAQYELACMYESGNGVRKNTKLAFKYFKQAADGDFAEAQYRAACYYDDDFLGEANRHLYLYYLRKAAENNVHEAQVELAELYEGSDVLNTDNEQVIKWLKAAADDALPLPLAQFNLAVEYRDGLHTDVNLKLAFKYMKLAADNNCESAFCNLGAMYRRGDGTRVNYRKAFYYFNKATCEFAIAHRGCMLLHGYGIKKDIPQAIEYLLTAAKKNEPHALYHLGECYEHGWGVTPDIRKAKNYYRRALKHMPDYQDAKDALNRLTKQ